MDANDLVSWGVRVQEAAARFRQAEDDLWKTVQVAHERLTWRQIADLLSVTPQAVQQRFSKPPPGRTV